MQNLNEQEEKLYNKIINILHSNKVRMTEPRLLIIKLLVIEEHLTLQDIVAKLKKLIGNVNVMSVYNTLDLLLEHHIIFANTFNGKSILYEIGMENSIHLKCDECQSLIHLNTRDTSLNSGFADIEKIANNNQMTLEHFKIEAHGKCANCLKKSK